MRKKPTHRPESPEEQYLLDLLKTMTTDDLRNWERTMLACVNCVRPKRRKEEANLIRVLNTMNPASLKKFKERLLVLADIVGPERHKPNPKDEAVIEIYAVKSFQAQDMSGRFNRSRMKQATKEAKLEVNHGN